MALPPDGTSILDLMRERGEDDLAAFMRDDPLLIRPAIPTGDPRNSVARAPMSLVVGPIERGEETYDQDTDSYTVRFNYRLGFNMVPPEHPRCRAVVHDGGTVTGRTSSRRPSHTERPRHGGRALGLDYSEIEARVLAQMAHNFMVPADMLGGQPNAAVPGPSAADAFAALADAMRRAGVTVEQMGQALSTGTLERHMLDAALADHPTPEPAPVRAVAPPRPTRNRRRMVR